MPEYIDHLWYGSPEAMAAALEGLTNVIGPRLIDGVAYATVRSATPLELPPGLGEVGPNLNAILLGTWAGDPAAVPAQVTNFQARTALRHAGLFEQAETAVDAMATLMEQEGNLVGADTLRDAWEKASFMRASPMVANLGAMIEVTPAQMDDLFRAAALIEV